MAFVLKDRVKETTTTTGTGIYTLAGAVTGYQSFSVVGDGNTTYYTVTDDTNWEVGIGTYTASGTTLSRDTILESSNAGSAVNWGAGSKDVFVTYPAERSLYVDGSSIVPASSATLAIANGGTGQSTADAALNALLPNQTSNSGKFLTTNGMSTSWASSGIASADIQQFTSVGTTNWTKPSGAKMVYVVVFGGGGGGGSGRRRGTANVATAGCSGGGGGGPGGRTDLFIPASLLGPTETVTVGGGGTGGAARTVDDQSGQLGNPGNNSSFGSWAVARGGDGGSGGGTSTGTGGAGGGNFNLYATGSAAYTNSGGGGGTSSGTNGSRGGYGAGGGGGGAGNVAGNTNQNTSVAGGLGGSINSTSTSTTGGGGTAGSAGGAGGAGLASSTYFFGGSGGGGGSSNSVGAAGAGGNGGSPGGGGGGGGAGGSSTNSGAGGNGGDGAVIVITFF